MLNIGSGGWNRTKDHTPEISLKKQSSESFCTVNCSVSQSPVPYSSAELQAIIEAWPKLSEEKRRLLLLIATEGGPRK